MMHSSTVAVSDGGSDATSTGTPLHRVESIDLLRGLVMVMMVLDHVRDYFTDSRINPTDLSSTTSALFFTRWITHFCAPTFVFLAGVGASLSGARKSRWELTRSLIWRGFWLIFLEQTWCNVTMFFTYPHSVLGLVLWAIGWSMIALAALIHLPRVVVGGIGVAMIVLHNQTDGFSPQGEITGLLWGILHVPGFRFLHEKVPILVGYPLIPWIGVMALGYAIGPLFLKAPERRRSLLLAIGMGSVAGFFILRFLNVYGDPQPWAVQSSPLRTAMSFLNCQKYPPSLLFLMMTLGPAFLALAAFDRGLGRAGHPLQVLGRVPLFFYLLQWPVAHGLAVLVALGRGEEVGWMFRFPPFEAPPGYGYSLPIVYLFWGLTVALLYYPSFWYSRLRYPPGKPDRLDEIETGSGAG
ncbi:DUF1624 domain-containing protein [Tundrisphaera lichenicola]|uniref:DUF1624 domain-containing protein n=1 Tax=Tundrisphaera lichenicola TaxID=2029860 RepID=UPI003EC0B672